MKVPYGELSGDELAIIYKDVTLEMMRRAVLAAMTTEAEDEAKVEVQPSESSTSSPGEPQGERQGKYQDAHGATATTDRVCEGGADRHHQIHPGIRTHTRLLTPRYDSG